ncbi:hypothetical protein CsSME_00016009 [Camellia sinensis var. sinensis]
MASFVSSAMSACTAPFCGCGCGCGFGPCVVMISRSSRNPGRAYYQCPHIVSTYVHKAVWDSDAVRLFLELVVKELEASYKGSFYTMTMHGYRAVSKAFQEHMNKFHEIDKNALKFKMKPLEHVELMRRLYEGNTANQAGPSNIYENTGAAAGT